MKTIYNVYQDGPDFYASNDERGEDTFFAARYPEMVANDYDMDGAGKARARFIAEMDAAFIKVVWA